MDWGKVGAFPSETAPEAGSDKAAGAGTTEANDDPPPRPWWKPHRPNLTGTPAAHRPTGSTLAQGRRPKATGDYKAWTPGR